MAITGIMVSLFLLISLSLAPGPTGRQAPIEGDLRMEEIKAELASPELSQREKFKAVLLAAPSVREKLFAELMAELRENPRKELQAWEVALLFHNGERVSIKHIAPDGHELSMEEIAKLFEGPFRGEYLTVEQVLQREGIITKHYWVPKEE